MFRTALVTALGVLLLSVPPAAAAVRHDSWSLHPGLTKPTTSYGPRVAALQWLISGHRPNVFDKVKPTLTGPYTQGYFGKPWGKTAAAVRAYKYRIGYPSPGQCDVHAKGVPHAHWNTALVGPYFFALLRGQRQRPTCWIALAQRRVNEVEPGVTFLAQRIKNWEVAQLGTYETCGGSCNRGWVRGPGGLSVDDYQRYVGLLGQAWCAIFQQNAFARNGAGFFLGPSYFVPTLIERARRVGWLNAKAKVGALIAYVNVYGVGYHIGFVTKVTASGYSSIEGNYGDRAAQRFHHWGDKLRVFIWDPKVTGR